MSGFKAIIFGATGAVGRELVEYLLNSDDYTLITLIVRRKIERWEKLESKKLNIIIVESLDFLIDDINKIKELIPDIHNYNSLFNTLGSRVKCGEEIFRKIEYTYVLKTLEICEKYNIKHFSFCSSNKANKDSWFLLWRVKGETEEELKKRKIIQKISVFHPGILMERDNDQRFGEGLMSWIPFIYKISVKDVAKSMFIVDLKFNNEIKKESKTKLDNNYEVLENDDMLKLCNENK